MAVDSFPQTVHVEVIALAERASRVAPPGTGSENTMKRSDFIPYNRILGPFSGSKASFLVRKGLCAGPLSLDLPRERSKTC